MHDTWFHVFDSWGGGEYGPDLQQFLNDVMEQAAQDNQELNTVATSSVMHLFSSFRPSERDVLKQLASSNKKAFVDAMDLYLQGWANGDWVEESSIERIAKWIARSCPADVVEQLSAHANEKLGVNAHHVAISPTPYQKTYKAMIVGLAGRRLDAR